MIKKSFYISMAAHKHFSVERQKK